MKFEMAPNSLFAILLRSSYWTSFAVAAGIVALSRVLLPPAYFPFGAVAALPFLVIGGIVLWRQLQRPSEARVKAVSERVRAMSWADFSNLLEAAYRRDGYEVSRVTLGAAELELRKAGRRTLVSGRRWKAGRTGIEPLRDLVTAREKQEVDEVVYVTAGAVTEQARQFATERRVHLVEAADLAVLLGRLA